MSSPRRYAELNIAHIDRLPNVTFEREVNGSARFSCADPDASAFGDAHIAPRMWVVLHPPAGRSWQFPPVVIPEGDVTTFRLYIAGRHTWSLQQLTATSTFK